MNQPTKEQEQWFWEQCGLRYYDKGNSLVMETPEGDFISEPDLESIEALGYLFKYAVPTLRERNYWVSLRENFMWQGAGHPFEAKVFAYNMCAIHESINEDPALALFWAIFSALEKTPRL